MEGNLSPLLVALTLIAAGCNTSDDAGQRPVMDLRELGKLPGVRQSPNQLLRDAVARVAETGGTPEQLGQHAGNDGGAAQSTAANSPAVADVVSVFGKGNIERLQRETDRLFPREQFQIDPIALEQALLLVRRHEAQLRQFAALFADGRCPLEIDFGVGFVNDRTFIDACLLYHGMTSFEIAELLQRKEPAAALARLDSVLSVVQCLAAQRHVEARLSAARMRQEALLVLEAIVQHPAATRADLTTAQQMMQRQLDFWPSDAEAWVGDRAMTMHSYELLRVGHFEMVFTDEDIDELDKEQILPYFTKAVARTIDNDELFYLETMQKIIESCQQPYYTRRPMLTALAQRLQDERQSPDYPLAAARLFLPDVDSAQRKQAADRARCECWALALAAALGNERPNYQLNPVTGQRYQQNVEAGRASVWTGDSQDRPFVAPLPSP